VDPTAGLDDVEKRESLTLPGLELRPLSRPVRSQSLYRLRYPGSGLDDVEKKTFLILPGLELDPSVVQPLASRYTDCAIPAPVFLLVPHSNSKLEDHHDCLFITLSLVLPVWTPLLPPQPTPQTHLPV
jgi:hypothetical protein